MQSLAPATAFTPPAPDAARGVAISGFVEAPPRGRQEAEGVTKIIGEAEGVFKPSLLLVSLASS